MLYSKQLEIPSDISVEIIDNEHIYDEEYGNVNMAYDESGTRIWERTYTRGGYQGSNVTIPGIGIYRKETLAGDFKLTHLDLVGGGFRKGLAEEAIYPMVDAQGNVRAYASASGIKSAYDYRPFGRVEELEENAVADERRWAFIRETFTPLKCRSIIEKDLLRRSGCEAAFLLLSNRDSAQGKEFDGEHGKYYFGARYFDPFFGMWMSPDPAGQFANPYSYGGDPLNYIDPTGMWAIGLGLVVGWDNKSGWSFGVGAAADFEIIGANFSYTFNQDGSKSLNLGVNADIPILTPWVYLEINMGLGFSMNSYSGATLSTHGGLCVGEATACAGVETGGSLYWDRGGSFMGATVYGEVYASLGYGAARVSAGYEAGLFGMEGRGLYAGASAGGLYAQYAQNGGWNYGWSMMVANGGYNSEKGWDYNIALVDLYQDAFDEDCADVPAYGKNEVVEGDDPFVNFDRLFNGGGAFGTNYVGATDNEKVGRMPITGDLDLAAFYHDVAYKVSKANGPTSALTDRRSPIIAADLRLAGRAFVSAVYNKSGLEQRRAWSVGTGVLFGSFAIGKMMFRYSGLNNPYLNNLWQ